MPTKNHTTPYVSVRHLIYSNEWNQYEKGS